MPISRFPRDLAGLACVAALRAARTVPRPLVTGLLGSALPAYPRLRPAHARRLLELFSASPFAGSLTLAGYYRTRLDLMVRGLALHGRPLDRGSIRISGGENWRTALAGGGPVAVVGLHMGLVEILHRLPEVQPGRPFRVITAPAFSHALTRFLNEGREFDGKRVLPNLSLAAGLREVAGASGILAFTADQVPGRPDAWLRLWNRIEIPWPARLLTFLRARGFRFIPVSNRLAADGLCEFRYHAPWDPAAPLEESLRGFLEESIAAAPDQWYWSYPKLRRVRDAAPLLQHISAME